MEQYLGYGYTFSEIPAVRVHLRRNTRGTTTDIICMMYAGFSHEGDVGYALRSDVKSRHTQKKTSTCIHTPAPCRQNHAQNMRAHRYSPWRMNMGDTNLRTGLPPGAPADSQNGSSSDTPPDPSGGKQVYLPPKKIVGQTQRWPMAKTSARTTSRSINWVGWVCANFCAPCTLTKKYPGCGYTLVLRILVRVRVRVLHVIPYPKTSVGSVRK